MKRKIALTSKPKQKKSLKKQAKDRSNRKPEGIDFEPFKGNSKVMISTGSTLLDLAISGTRKEMGGIPGGILVEIFGDSGLGKTVFLAEIAGDIQRKGGDVLFNDPEARLDAEFASIFDYKLDEDKYLTPDTVLELFSSTRKWEPKPTKEDAVNGVMADSLAALSTEMEMTKEEGDKMGGKRAKDFSEQTRKTCRFLKKKNTLMVCSNQIRQNMNTMGFGAEKYTTPGGEAIKFYSSLRLKVKKPAKDSRIKVSVTSGKKSKETERVVGITTEVEVYKSSVDVPYRKALVTILFNYGIDDIRQNLIYLKAHEGTPSYMVGEIKLGQGLEAAMRKVEADNLEKKVRKRVAKVWMEIEAKVKEKNQRKSKVR